MNVEITNPNILKREFSCVFYKTIEELFKEITGKEIWIAAEQEWKRGTSVIVNAEEKDLKFQGNFEKRVSEWIEDDSYPLHLRTIFFYLASKGAIPFGKYIIYDEEVSIE